MEEVILADARVSTPHQKLDRQIDNIRREYPKAEIFCEKYTGTTQDRPVWRKLMAKVDRLVEECKQRNDTLNVTIVFDSVSRMSRNADEGVAEYERLFKMGVKLVFLKEPYINTANIKEQIDKAKLDRTKDEVDILLEAIEKYLVQLAKKQVRLAFEQAEKEVEDTRKRTIEGIEQARKKGKHIGGFQDRKLVVKKAAPAKEIIKKFDKLFNPDSNLMDKQVMELAHVSKNTYYKYRAELLADAAMGDGSNG